VNTLLLTSEFAPVTGGVGTYAREITAAATDLSANVTVVVPDYAQGGAALSTSLTQARTLMTVHDTAISETRTPLKRLAIRTAGVFGSRTEIAARNHAAS
jgi:phosphatidyl-myo-inositol dimannoside synthase